VVVLHFPFSDLTQTKRRPALVLATLSDDDIILCQITSQSTFDGYSVVLAGSDFASGGLNRESNVRPNRLFTADSSIVLYKAGHITEAKLAEVIARVISILK
jgi:mRNA interferase MazF